jgi:hypothetical protein
VKHAAFGRDQAQNGEEKRMTRPPIVIIGAARSGTSFLRDLLAQAPGLSAVPYDVNYIWRYGRSHSGDDALLPDNLTSEQKLFIQSKLSKLAKTGKEGRLLEKTVSNTLRIGFVDKVFPDAKFIYLERDGRNATASSMRQWQAKPNWAHWRRKLSSLPIGSLSYTYWAAKNLALGRGRARIWGPRYPGIEGDLGNLSQVEVCAKQWLICCQMARAGLSNLAPERVFHISFEALMQSSAPLENLLKWAQLDAGEPVLRAYAERVHKPEKYFDQLSAQDRTKIDQQLSHFLVDHGYT